MNASNGKDTSLSTPNDATLQQQLQNQLQQLFVLSNNNEHNKNIKEENDKEIIKKSIFVLYIYFLYIFKIISATATVDDVGVDQSLGEENKKLRNKIVQLRIENMEIYRKTGEEIDALQKKMIEMHRKNYMEITQLQNKLTIKKLELARVKNQLEKLKKHLANLIKSKKNDDENDN